MNADRINEVYDGTHGSPAIRERARRRIHWLCAQAAGGDVLDAGCSQGIASLLLGREGRTVIGIDRERSAIDYANEQLAQEEPEVQARVGFQVGELTALPFPEARFDAVLLGEVLEHQLDPRPILAEARRVLRPGGVLAITTPYGRFPYDDHKEPIYLEALLAALVPGFAIDDLSLLDVYLTIAARPHEDAAAIDWRAALRVAEERLRREETSHGAQKTAARRAGALKAANQELQARSARLEQELADQGDAVREAVLGLAEAREQVDALRTERRALRAALRQEATRRPEPAPETNGRPEAGAPSPVITGPGSSPSPVALEIAPASPKPRQRATTSVAHRPHAATAAKADTEPEPADAAGWLALARARVADPQRAVAAALRAAELADDPFDALWFAGGVQQRLAGQAAFVELVERLGPLSRLSDAQLLLHVERTIRVGTYALTEAAATELEGRRHGHPVARYARAVTRWESGDDEGAEAAAAPLWAAGATDEELHAGVRYLLRANDVVRAGELLGRLAEPDVKETVLVARRLRQEGSLLPSLTTIAMALAAAPQNAQARAAQLMTLGDTACVEDRWAPPAVPRPLPRVPGRVLHVLQRSAPHHLAGNTVRTHSIGRAQARKGLDVHVVTEAGFPWNTGVEDAELCDVLDDVRYHRLPDWDARSRPALDERLCRFLHLASELVEELRPAVLHPHSTYVNALVALELGRRFGIPVVYEVRGFPEERPLTPQHSRSRVDVGATPRRLEQRCWQRADHVTTLAEVMARHIAASGVAADKVTVVPNAIDPDELQPAAPDRELAAEIGLPQDVPVVGYISTFARYDGIEYLIRAVGRLRDRGRHVHCLLVGDGSEREALEAEVDALGLRDRVTFTGFVAHDQINRYYSLLDVFVVPRNNERVSNLVTPLKPYEAMATGRALVMSRTEALSEMAVEDETARFFVPEDPDSLADVLEPLFGDPADRAALGARARAWVTEHRTWERNVERYQAIYDRLGAM
jgi:glycosyltransferase involved in cell wall biosynthesis/SAM-dependent methyltransferase